MQNDEQTKTNLRSAYGDYLRRSFHWTHFITLTFSEPPSVLGAWREFHRWIERAKLTRYENITWFAAIEQNDDGSRHLHAVVSMARPSCKQLGALWYAGYSQIHPYDASRPGVHYVTKSLNESDAEYDFNLPTLD